MASKDFQINIPKKVEAKFIELIARRSSRLIMRYFLLNYSKQGSEADNQFVAWRERKDKKNKNPLLVKSGDMKSSFKTSVRNNGFLIENLQPYFQYHQEGTEHIPQREMLYHNEHTDKIITKEIDLVITNLLGF